MANKERVIFRQTLWDGVFVLVTELTPRNPHCIARDGKGVWTTHI